jgi:hypothetical protein
MALTPYESMFVAYNSVRDETGLTKPLKPEKSLDYYGVVTPQQCYMIRLRIIGPGVHSVQAFRHSIGGGRLAMLNNGWTMGQLAAVVESNAIPQEQSSSAAAPVFSEDEKVTIAFTKMAEAISILQDIAPAKSGTPNVNVGRYKKMTLKSMTSGLGTSGKKGGATEG